jgi:hypothetical protein
VDGFQLWGLGGRLKLLTVKPLIFMNLHREPLTRKDSLARSKHRKIHMRFSTWNVKSSLKTAARESEKCKIDLVCVQEIRWEMGGA